MTKNVRLETEPAVRTTLKPPRGKKSIIVTLSGARLAIDGVPQELATPAEAKKQLDALIRLRLRDGYTLGAVDIVADEPPQEEEAADVGTEEPAAAMPTVDYDEHRRWRVSFDGACDAKTCAALATRLRVDAPRVVRIVCDGGSPGAVWAEALAEVRLPSVRDLIFDCYFQTQTRQGRSSLGDLRATLDACPSLERLFATGALAITRGSHAKLRALHALGDPLSSSFLRVLAQWKLPALEQLVLSLASDAAPGDDDAAIALVLGLDAPRLASVHVDALADLPLALDRLLTSGRPRRWKELRLAGALDEDALLDVVERHVDALRALDVLGLPLGDEVSSDGDERLRALCPSVRDLEQLAEVTLPAAYDAWRDE